MLPQQTTVLIVGAGPAGLAAAVSLAHQGCKDIVIVDAVERHTRPLSSRALIIHSATLEALETINCTSALLSIGTKVKAANFYASDGLLSQTDFSTLESYTKYPFSLLVSQYSTERVLEAKLEEMGMRVERPYRLVGLDDEVEGEAGEVRGLIATFENEETVRAKYVIGADGARSAVRQLAHIGFSDLDGQSINDKDAIQMVLADVTFNTPPAIPRDQFYSQLSDDNFCITIPVPRSPYSESYDHLDETIFRIGFTVPKADGPPPSAPTVEYFQTYLDRLRPKFLVDGEGGIAKIEKTLWSTRFRMHAAIADKFLVRIHAREKEPKQYQETETEETERSKTMSVPRVVFLIGDAAHIHSPIGGQGMNLGLRDAIGLGPILAKNISLFSSSPSSADEVLEDYATIRHARAVTTIRFTKRSMASIAFIASNGWTRYLVSLVKLVLKVPAVRGAMMWQVSGLGNR